MSCKGIGILNMRHPKKEIDALNLRQSEYYTLQKIKSQVKYIRKVRHLKSKVVNLSKALHHYYSKY